MADRNKFSFFLGWYIKAEGKKDFKTLCTNPKYSLIISIGNFKIKLLKLKIKCFFYCIRRLIESRAEKEFFHTSFRFFS